MKNGEAGLRAQPDLSILKRGRIRSRDYLPKRRRYSVEFMKPLTITR